MRFKICSHELFVELLCKDGRCLQKKHQYLPIHSLDIYRVNCVWALRLGKGQGSRVPPLPPSHRLYADELWPWKRPQLWGPVSSAITRWACCSLEDPSSSRRPSDLPDSHIRHLRMASHSRNEVSLPPETSQSAGTLSLAYSHQRLPKMV